MNWPWGKKWSPKRLEEAAKAQDQEAFDKAFAQFFTSELPGFHHHLSKKYGLKKEDAEDIIQQSILVTYENVFAGAVKDLSRLFFYFRRVAERQSIAALRQKEKTIQQLQDYAPGKGSPLPVLDENWVATLRILLKELGDKCKRILLYFYGGLSMEEIAVELEYKNREVAKKSKQRCLDRLKEQAFAHPNLPNA